MKNMKLFPKTFLHCLMLIVSVLLIAFLLLYSFLPAFYRGYKQREINTNTAQLATELEGCSVTDLSSAIFRYAVNKGYGYSAEYENGDVICSVNTGIGMAFVEGDIDSNGSININMDSAESSSSFQTADHKTVILTMNTSLAPIDDAVAVLMYLLPPLLLICIVISAVISWIYAHSIVKPVKAITDATVQMTTLSPNVVCKTDRKDEIGILSQNISNMYDKLLITISDLEQQIDATQKAEQEKLDFLLLASHELKTPVTAVRGMVDGMLYNVGIYKNRDYYLSECQNELEHLTELLCSILENSKMDVSTIAKNKSDTNIGDLLKKVFSSYLPIAESKGVHLTVNTENSFSAKISAELIEKVFSNILSNAVKYTASGKCVFAYMENSSVIIENECLPLTDEEMEHITEPFYHPAKDNKKDNDSTGLGLYFTDKIVSACDLTWSFLPYENGMRFILDF